MLEVLTDDDGHGQFDLGLGKICREGARQMLHEVLEREPGQDRWRAVDGPHLVPLVRADAVFHLGVLVERAATAAA